MTAQIPAERAELLEKIRQQFDNAPYPRIEIEESANDNPYLLYIHNLVTSYYRRNQKVIETKGKVILDAGCGSGFKLQVLAEANPGVKVVGIDLSEPSVKLAEQRLKYHGFDNAEFHVMLVEDLPKLGIQFDYINCDDVLYLLPDWVAGLKAMKSVLKPNGIIRVNLHSSLQRAAYYRAQELFKFMGLMENNPEEMELGVVRDTMNALKDNILLKAQTWNPTNAKEDATILANHLLVGDKGSTIPEFFHILRASGLEFVSMTNWLQWDLMDLFQEPDNLPAYLAMSFPDLCEEEKLYLYELFHPVHRLLDLWCGHPQQEKQTPAADWEDSEWQNSTAYLHPQLKTPKFREDLIGCVTDLRTFSFSNHLTLMNQAVSIDSAMAICLIPLFDRPQSVTFLVNHWQQIRPLDPVTMQPIDRNRAFELVQQMLLRLEVLGYVMLES